jgi:PBSX family phage portal protein
MATTKKAGKPDPKKAGKPDPKRLPVDGRYVQLRGLGFGGKAIAESRAIDPETDPFTQLNMYHGVGPRPLLYPPLGEQSLRQLVEIAAESNILEECVAAYEENIEGFGYRLEPIPTTEDLEADPELKTAVEAEADRVRTFFEYCWADGSFIELRKRLRRDMETIGFGALEVLRARAGDVSTPITGFGHVPAHSVRISPPDKDAVQMTELRRIGTELVPVKVYRRFRYYCQVRRAARALQPVWFKEFGDPRAVNWDTGKVDTDAVLGTTQAATEMLLFPVKYYALSPYSIPRWLGNLPAVLGSRAAEEINVWYFDNKMIPPMMLLVSGGALTKGTIRRLEEKMEYQAKGRENFHRVLVVEARQQETGPQGSRPPKLEIKPLTEGQIQDAMFMGYDGNTRMKIRAAFRLPPLLTGETTDYNRATAETARQVSEEQVFRPERLRFDYTWDRRVMPGIGVRYHRFVSSGPNVTLNEDLIAAMPAAEAVGAMTPNLALAILSDVLERQLPKIEEPWGDRPFTLTLAGMASLGTEDGTAPAPETEPPAGAAVLRSHRGKVQRLIEALQAKRVPRELVGKVLAQLRPVIESELRRRERANAPAVLPRPRPDDDE